MSAKKSKPYICGTQLIYCKFGNVRENFISANSVKRHICDVKMRLEHNLPISVNVCVFSRGFYFHETSHMQYQLSYVSSYFYSEQQIPSILLNNTIKTVRQ